MYVYIKSEPCLYTVGFYSPDGKWNPESDWYTKCSAVERVFYLNGRKGKNAELTWKYCSTCNPDSRIDCEACWSEWESK